MPCYDNIDGALRLASGLYGNVEGTLRTVQTGYDNIEGTLRQYHTSSLELYNSGVKDVAIGYQSGSHFYDGWNIACGGWDDGSTIHIFPQKYREDGYGKYPSMSAQVDFAVCDWYSRYLCMTLKLESDMGKAYIYAKNAPNGSVLKQINFATVPHYEGYNSGSGNDLNWSIRDNITKYDICGFGAIGLPFGQVDATNQNPAKTYTICADLSLMTTHTWSLSIQMLPEGISWGTQYSPDWRISRIWQSDEIPPGIQFTSAYKQNYNGNISAQDFGMNWFNNAF